jgi:hypothetical protein
MKNVKMTAYQWNIMNNTKYIVGNKIIFYYIILYYIQKYGLSLVVAIKTLSLFVDVTEIDKIM